MCVAQTSEKRGFGTHGCKSGGVKVYPSCGSPLHWKIRMGTSRPLRADIKPPIEDEELGGGAVNAVFGEYWRPSWFAWRSGVYHP
jgi:hypothetical protein